MRLSTVLGLITSGRAGAMRRILGMATDMTRAHFLVSAAQTGLLRTLAEGPRDEPEIAARLDLPADHGGLHAWLEVGLALGELGLQSGSWSLKGRLARALAEERNDDLAAVLEEVATLHVKLLQETPQRLRDGRAFTLDDQDGKLVARSSRALEPLLMEVVAEHVPAGGPFRLLEVGCGSGVYLRHAAERNRNLTAIGLELQPEVARLASANLASWGLDGRVHVEAQDLRERRSEQAFDLVTLHNNIYYFPVAERVEVLRHAASFLVSGGKLLLTTLCPGSPTGAMLHLWGEMTEGCGGLPEPDALCAQMREAGLQATRFRNVGAPLERFFSFVGTRV